MHLTKATHLGWSSFRIACTLFYTGMRSKEAFNFTEEMILQLLLEKSIIIYQSKTSQERCLTFSDHTVKKLEELKKDREIVFTKPMQKLYPNETKQNLGFIRLLNHFLKPYREKYNLKLNSHSFIVNYVTQTLKYSSLKDAQELVGHKDIISTLMYNRHRLSKEERKNIRDSTLGQ